MAGCAGGGGRILWRMAACKCSPRRMQVLTTAVAGSFGACKCSPRRWQDPLAFLFLSRDKR